jgi:hypothetical protein
MLIGDENHAMTIKTLPLDLPSLTHICVCGMYLNALGELAEILDAPSIQRVLVQLSHTYQPSIDASYDDALPEDMRERHGKSATVEPRLKAVRCDYATDQELLGDWLERVQGGEGCWAS